MKIFWQFLGSCAIAAVVICAGFLLCHVFCVDLDITSWWIGYLTATAALTIITMYGGRRGR